MNATSAAAAGMIADLMRALTKLEEEDRVVVPDGLLAVCRRCGAVGLAETLPNHRDDCPYAVMAKVLR